VSALANRAAYRVYRRPDPDLRLLVPGHTLAEE
jgi:hypothetical protein